MARRAQRTQAQRAVDEDVAGQQVLKAADDAVRARHAARARKTEREILKGIEAAKSMGKILAFPDVRTLSSILPGTTPVTNLGNYRSTAVHTFKDAVRLLPDGRSDAHGECTVSEYVSVHGEAAVGHHGLRMESLPPAMADWVAKNMMVTDGISISFQVTVRDNGTALVTAHHLQLSGSRWLAIVHASSVPGLEGA